MCLAAPPSQSRSSRRRDHGALVRRPLRPRRRCDRRGCPGLTQTEARRTAAAAENLRRKRRTFVNATPVGLGEFKENPITSIRWGPQESAPAEEARLVPIPPQLVSILRQHLNTFGTAEDGRLFANECGGVVGSSTYFGVCHEARPLALPPAARRLAARPYTPRHSAPSTWLNAGVDATEVAERAGNSV